MSLLTAIFIGFVVAVTLANFSLWFYFMYQTNQDTQDEKLKR